MYLKGYSIGGVIKEVASKNLLSSTGKERWYNRSIDNILSNEKYVDDVELFKADQATETYLAKGLSSDYN